MTDGKERIGFIGLGIMGLPMARNLMRAGYTLTVNNRSPEPQQQLAAEGATLSIMVGGSEEGFERARPVSEAVGKNIVHIGGPGAGQVTKVCNQIVVALTIQAVAEAMTLARKSGVDASRVREALLGGFAQSRILDLHGQRILDGNFKPGFRVSLHRKDLRLALEAGREQAAPLFVTAGVAELTNSMIAQGMGDLDHSGLARLYGQLAGLD